jgi:soluble lytic murein transglycosylase-like protein
MLSVSSTLRLFVALIALFASGTAAAVANGDDEGQYAALLRTINPHLQVHQSIAYAHSLVVDAQRANLDPRLIVALVTVESHWHPNAISPVGARGLGQLMPGTAAILGVNAWDPSQNIRGATTYLRAMINHFASSGHNMMPFAIGAYNAGPRAVDRYHGIPPYTETQNYVRKVMAMWRKVKVRLGTAFEVPNVAVTSAASADDKMWLASPNASALAVSDAQPPILPASVPAATLPPADAPPAP